MESCGIVVRRWILRVVLFFCWVNSCRPCRRDDDCPNTHVCQRDQSNGICVKVNEHPKENGIIVGILSAMIVLILCLVALLAYICHRNVWRRSSWDSQTSLTIQDNDTLERRTVRIVRRASSQAQNALVTVPRYFLQRQLSVASNYSGPPPYFSIFSVLSEDTQRVRRTDIDSSEVLEIDAIQVCELPPPSYETVEEVLSPPRYEDAVNMNK